MTTEVKSIKGMVVNEIFLVDPDQIYRQQALPMIAEAHTKNIRVIIRCATKQNEIDMSVWLKKKDVQANAASSSLLTLRGETPIENGVSKAYFSSTSPGRWGFLEGVVWALQEAER